MSPELKARVDRAYRSCLLIAAIDLVLAFICAINGNAGFVFFMILAGLMWGTGTYFKAKVEEIGE